MRILLTGATGFLGTRLAKILASQGHDLIFLSRRSGPTPQWIQWDPSTILETPDLETIEGIIHLAGEPIADRRWTTAQKKKIYDSRIVGTRNLVKSFARVRNSRLKVFFSASAIGYYGNRGDEILTEDSHPGSDFLSKVCQDWESEALRGVSHGWRVVCVRTGVVLSPRGGALKKMLPIFRLGLGGKLGSGQHWMSWIGLEDWVSIFPFLLAYEKISGPINGVSPYPITNREFTQTLSQVLRRPAVLGVPGFFLKMTLGEMSQVLLASQRVAPSRLLAAGYTFQTPHLKDTLTELRS